MLAFFYPLNSAHHYLWSPIPMFVQHFAIVASVGVHVVIYTVVWNFVGTVWGAPGKAWRVLPARYFYTGALFYLLTCIQCAIQVQLSVQAIIHFTDWVVGHAHFVMFGVFGLWALGFSQHLWPKLVGADRIYSRKLAEAHWYLSTLGIFLMWVDLMIVGLIEGFDWKSLGLFTSSIRSAVPFWMIRSLAGAAVALGQLLLFWNFFVTWHVARRVPAPTTAPPLPEPAPLPPLIADQPHEHPPARRFERAPFVLVFAGAGCFFLAFVALGVMPFALDGHVRINVVQPSAVPADLAAFYKDPAEYKLGLDHGRRVYIAENCWNCHTQFVRPVGNEEARYGPVQTLEETMNDMNLPQLFGTRRVGPDLSREHGKHSNDWHLAHLYDPRLVVPESVMPSYPWFFEKDGDGRPRPTRRAIDLVAYLQWLGGPIELAPREVNR
jgi:cytochrome c oxidase cbb3-type subunit I/II